MSPTSEEMARALKVEKLATAAERAGVSADDLQTIVDLETPDSPEDDTWTTPAECEAVWDNLTKLADTRPPSLKTKIAVVAELRRRIKRAAKHPDPFEGLPGVEPLTDRARAKAADMKASGYKSKSGR